MFGLRFVSRKWCSGHPATQIRPGRQIVTRQRTFGTISLKGGLGASSNPARNIFVALTPKIRVVVAFGVAGITIAGHSRTAVARTVCQAQELQLHAEQQRSSILNEAWQAIQHLVSRILRTASLIRRFVRLSLTFLAPLAALYPVARFLPIGAKEDGVAVWWWRFLVWQLEQGGPTAIKFGQWAGTRRDLFSDGFCNHVSQLHAASKIHRPSHTRRLIERELGVPFNELFEQFDERPIGSGCVGQVHRAVLRLGAAARVGLRAGEGEGEGREVVVKVLHPRVSDTIAKDLAIMHFLASAVQKLPGMKWFGLVNSVEQFSTVMRDQLDFRIEAGHLSRFRANFQNDDSIVFPKPLYPYVTADVLMETYEHGRPIADYIDRSENDLGRPEDRRSINARLARMGLRAFLKMVLLDNFAHSDLHPGNILVRERANGEAQLVFLDAGIITELSDKDSDNFLALFDGIAYGNGEHVGYLMIENAREQECTDPAEFARVIGSLVARVHTSTLCLSKVDVSDILTQVLTLVRQHKVMIEPNFASLVLGIAVVEGLGRSLDPNVDIIKTSLPILLKARLRRALAADAFGDQSERDDWEAALAMDSF